MRIVKTKSIPNVDSDRLIDSIQQLHHMLHTPEGLHGFDEPRRGLIDNGRKALRIRDELHARGVDSRITCRWCGTNADKHEH